MTDKTPKADALRAMREKGPERIGPFKVRGDWTIRNRIVSVGPGECGGSAIVKKRQIKARGKK
jgi:hypothetical protein